MRPVRLRLKGFTSFKDGADVSFENLDRFAICGPTGAGKSSLLDALTFALFAEAPRRGTGNLANLISLGRKSFSVTFDFRVGDQTFRVARVRRRSGTGSDQLEKLDGQDKVELVATGERAVTEKIERLLGLNYGHFTQAVFLPQGKFSEFLKAKPAERRRLLNELLRLLIYERMQEHAGRERDTHGGRKSQTERRLREDFDGVTTEARAELERQQQSHLRILAEADAVLPGLHSCREEARRGRTWTVELEAKQGERTRHQAALPDIEAARQAVDAANRAADVIPLLHQADTAGQEEQRRKQAHLQAIQACEQRRAEHRKASLALAQATEAIGELPALRSRLNLLNVAKGKLGLRDQLLRQLNEHRQRHRTLADYRATTLATAEVLATEVAAIELDFSQAEADLEAIGFDEGHLRRLEAQLPTAVRLQAEHVQLAEVRDRAQKDEVDAANLAAAAEAAAQTSLHEEWAAASAGQRAEEAEETLRAAETAHAASHIRAGLRPGHLCPVCRQEVADVPSDAMVPELDQLRLALVTAKSHLASATRTASHATKASAAARAASDASQRRAESSRSDLDRRQQQIALRERTLVEVVGDLVDLGSPAPIEEQVIAAARTAADRHALHIKAVARQGELRTKLALKKKDRESRTGQIERLDEELRVLTDKFAADTLSLSSVRNEIYEAAGTHEPGVESDRVQGEISRLEAEIAKSTQAERATSDRLRLAESLVETCAREESQASSRSADARALATSALRKAGFTDDNAVRTAHLTATQVRAMQERITEYDAMCRALDHRIAELDTSLQGRRVSAEECTQAELAYDACTQRRKASETQAAIFGQQLKDMDTRLERAKQLRKELADQEQLHRVFDWLARDLRNDRFQAYLLEETLAGLIDSASCQLTRLTGDRYGLAFEDDRIFVIDHDNAGERRGVETLSGGELFLASLALALALSEQVQKAAGAVRLDCLFVDEGFGTLDPETLRTVSDAIRGLQVGSRMVGIITHVPELREEFDQRLVVEKEGGSSRVQIDVA